MDQDRRRAPPYRRCHGDRSTHGPARGHGHDPLDPAVPSRPDPRRRPVHHHVARHPGAVGIEPAELPVRRAPRQTARPNAKALLGEAFRAEWAEKRRDDGYTTGSGADPGSPKGRMAAIMQQFVDRFEQTPVVVLATNLRRREPHVTDGASVYPACQNLLLAARALGYGGVMTMWHAAGRPAAARVPRDPRRGHVGRDDRARAPGGPPRSCPAPAGRRARLRGRLGDAGRVGRRPGRHALHGRGSTSFPWMKSRMSGIAVASWPKKACPPS